jgi:hypothetical protein
MTDGNNEMLEVEVLEINNDILARCEHFAASSGNQCKVKPVKGYPFCMTHLNTASVSEIALVRGKDVLFSDIRGRKIENPLEELGSLVSEVLVYKDYCAMQVAKLRGDERYEGRGGEQLRAEVALYERSLDRAGRMLIEWSRLDIDERLMKIEEAKAMAILEVIRRALLAAELDEDTRAIAEKVAIKELKALGRGR